MIGKKSNTGGAKEKGGVGVQRKRWAWRVGPGFLFTQRKHVALGTKCYLPTTSSHFCHYLAIIHTACAGAESESNLLTQAFIIVV